MNGDVQVLSRFPSAWGERALFAGVVVIAVGMAVSLPLLHAGLGIGLLGLLLTRSAIHRHPGFWCAVAYAGWQVISMVAGSLQQGGEPLLQRRFGGVYTWLSLYVAIEAFRMPAARLWAIVAMSLATGASLLLATAQFFLGYGGRGPFRINGSGISWTSSGFFPKHLTQGFMMSQIALLTWTQVMMSGSGVLRGVHWLGRIAPLLCILLTGGRTGLVGIISAWYAWFGCVSRRRFLVATGVMCVTAALAIGWLLLVRPTAVTDAAALRDGRIIHWQVASELIREHPFIGIGGGEEFPRENARVIAQLYPDGSQDVWRDAPDAHNSFLGLASEHGIPAVILYLVFLGSLLLHLWRHREESPWAWRLGCGSITCALVAGQFEHFAGHSVSNYGVYVTVGFAIALTLPERRPFAPPTSSPESGSSET